MTTIKASCPVCGDVSLAPNEVRLVVCSNEAWSYYAFTCSECTDEVRKAADEEIIALLISGGVRAQDWHIPAEALEPHAGEPISYDELLDFALWLDGTDELTASVAPLTGG
jgi:hypothetical protein